MGLETAAPFRYPNPRRLFGVRNLGTRRGGAREDGREATREGDETRMKRKWEG